MSTTSADPITLTGSQRRALKRLVRAGRGLVLDSLIS